MPSSAVVKTLCRELFTRSINQRIPEPDLVMDDLEKVAAYTRAGREDGVMAPVYLFHCAQICEILKPGGVAVDLACGPATQLGMVARLNPDTKFYGVDLSSEMLERASDYVAQEKLDNIELLQGDISRLASFEDQSVDSIFSTVALHHLPDEEVLARTFREIARVIKPGGGIYLVDFGRLKSEKSIQYFANQYANNQPELFTLDYLYSLRAAFTLQDFKRLASSCLPQAKVSSTFLMPFMVAIKTQNVARMPSVEVLDQIRALQESLPPHHKTDLSDLKGLFKLGGLPSMALA